MILCDSQQQAVKPWVKATSDGGIVKGAHPWSNFGLTNAPLDWAALRVPVACLLHNPKDLIWGMKKTCKKLLHKFQSEMIWDCVIFDYYNPETNRNVFFVFTHHWSSVMSTIWRNVLFWQRRLTWNQMGDKFIHRINSHRGWKYELKSQKCKWTISGQARVWGPSVEVVVEGDEGPEAALAAEQVCTSALFWPHCLHLWLGNRLPLCAERGGRLR